MGGVCPASGLVMYHPHRKPLQPHLNAWIFMTNKRGRCPRPPSVQWLQSVSGKGQGVDCGWEVASLKRGDREPCPAQPLPAVALWFLLQRRQKVSGYITQWVQSQSGLPTKTSTQIIYIQVPRKSQQLRGVWPFTRRLLLPLSDWLSSVASAGMTLPRWTYTTPQRMNGTRSHL